ncbi:MAG: hypothetical protein A2Z25_00785 [Planctomycetes bacterium RBG_16_55_9]|nr:MAG: hypothetical protein A2Z25_00785 [Planctomycetes bacterium RBG_16_55_9]
MSVVLLLSTGVFAVGHEQGFSFHAINAIERIGCVGSASGSNVATVGQAQKAYNAVSGTTTLQRQNAELTQRGRTTGTGGRTTVTQEATADGTQNQRGGAGFGGRGIRSQGQSLSVSLDTLMSNTRGIGGAVGAQGFVGNQSQIAVGPNGIDKQSQSIDATQFSTVSGNASINSSLDVVLNQSRNVVQAQ